MSSEAMGGEKALRQNGYINAIPGSNWAEHVMGTHAGSLAVIHDRPFQVHPVENFCLFLRENTTAASPIHDPETGSLIGALTISENCELVHPHTLGMIEALVKLIEKQIMTTRMKNKAEVENHYKALVMESAAVGLIAIDNRMLITHINQRAMNTFGFVGNIIGKNICSVLSNTFGTIKNAGHLVDIVKAPGSVTDEFINIPSASGMIRCAVTTRNIQFREQVAGKIITIQEMSRVNRIVSRTLGNYASYTFNDMVGEDEGFMNCIETAVQVSNSSSSILLLGESGTGKDLFAQSIHNASGRRDRPYVAINCAAIPKELMGSELFGYAGRSFHRGKKRRQSR